MDPRQLLYTLVAAARVKLAHVLGTEEREGIPKSQFAIPERAGTSQGKAESGSYPIPDREHARAALGLVGMHGSPSEKYEVRAKVHAAYPDMGGGQ